MDWGALARAAATAGIGAAGDVLKQQWATVKGGAASSLQALAQAAVEIEVHGDEMSEAERHMVIDNQKLALKGVLLGHESIGTLIAEQAVAAAWDAISGVISTALKLG